MKGVISDQLKLILSDKESSRQFFTQFDSWDRKTDLKVVLSIGDFVIKPFRSNNKPKNKKRSIIDLLFGN